MPPGPPATTSASSTRRWRRRAHPPTSCRSELALAGQPGRLVGICGAGTATAGTFARVVLSVWRSSVGAAGQALAACRGALCWLVVLPDLTQCIQCSADCDGVRRGGQRAGHVPRCRQDHFCGLHPDRPQGERLAVPVLKAVGSRRVVATAHVKRAVQHHPPCELSTQVLLPPIRSWRPRPPT